MDERLLGMGLLIPMGIIESISRVFKPVRRDDPVFGPMRYIASPSPYWEGKAHFPTDDELIEVFVDGIDNDDMRQQHAFFATLRKEWPNLRDEIGKSLLREWREWEPEAPAKPVWDEFTVNGMSIPKALLETNTEWDISFSPRAKKDYLFTAYMKGHQVKEVSVDT